MPSIVQEFLIGILGGILTVPIYFLLWPALPMLSRLTANLLRPGLLTTLLQMLWLLMIALAVIGIPALISQAILARWQLAGMDVNVRVVAGRTTSAAAVVYVAGMLLGIKVVMQLGKLSCIRKVHQRWEAWLNRLYEHRP